MDSSQQQVAIPPQPNDQKVSAPHASQQRKKRSPRRRLIVACFVTGLITFLVTSISLAGAYLLGRAYDASSLEDTRQTVVQEGEVIADVAQKVSPSVVSIITEQQSRVNSLYFGSRVQTSRAAGTGLVIDKGGLILTNKHVVPEGVSSVQIVTSDGDTYDNVQVLGRDPLNDLAVLRASEAADLPVATLANSDSVRIGQKVVAIGNALGQFQNTVTSGIISGKGRPVEAGDESGAMSEQLSNLFQTDAAINSGNSGGPLLNLRGEVIGINTAIAADAENIGFAIPINEAKGIIESVRSTGKVSRPYIGVRFIMLTPDTADELGLRVSQGAYISTEPGSVVSGGPAEKAGLQSGDVIIRVNDIELNEGVALTSAIGRFKVGEQVKLSVLRDNRTITVDVTLAEAPNS